MGPESLSLSLLGVPSEASGIASREGAEGLPCASETARPGKGARLPGSADTALRDSASAERSGESFVATTIVERLFDLRVCSTANDGDEDGRKKRGDHQAHSPPKSYA